MEVAYKVLEVTDVFGSGFIKWLESMQQKHKKFVNYGLRF